MSDEDEEGFTTEVTGGYNPGNHAFFLNLKAEGANIRIDLDDVGDEDSRLRLKSMIDDLPNIAAEVTGKMLGEISEAILGMLSQVSGEDGGIEPPRSTIYTPGSLDGS